MQTEKECEGVGSLLVLCMLWDEKLSVPPHCVEHWKHWVIGVLHPCVLPLLLVAQGGFGVFALRHRLLISSLQQSLAFADPQSSLPEGPAGHTTCIVYNPYATHC